MEYIPYKPALYGVFETRFYNQAMQLVELQQRKNPLAEIDAFIQSEVQWAVNGAKINPQQRRIYRAVWLLLRDLLQVGWKTRWHLETLQLLPPTHQQSVHSAIDIKAEKRTLKLAMAWSREAKIAEAREFILRMENPSQSATASVPVTALIADGKQIAEELRLISSIPDRDDQIAELSAAIQPYLQLISEDARCVHTGHKLLDIWRYFRYTWSVSAESTPGRSLHYLIRDAARPYHPIVGIASLGNAVIRSPDRDHELGWSTRFVGTQILNASDDLEVKTIFEELLKHIQTSIEEVYWEDLCRPGEIDNPEQNVIRRLMSVADQASQARKEAIDEWQQQKLTGETTLERSELGNISLTAEEALYRAKRATRLYKLLSAKSELQNILYHADFAETWRAFVGSISENGQIEREEARGVIRTAIRAVKARHIGTSILELNVCGSIPPYNEILGGKLVALMMLSPQVVSDYRTRYGTRPSDIASRMKKDSVVRPAELVFLGTTSLYRVGASQYNRLKFPSGLLRSDAPEVRWKEIGETAGYGTLHISNDTLLSLQEATPSGEGAYVHNVFGEGASPKLRALRHAISTVLDIDQSHSSVELTQHTMNRLIYGAWLAANGREYLNGKVDEPDYYFDSNIAVEEQTNAIIDFWRERWLLKRINFEKALKRMGQFSPEDIRLGKQLNEIEQHEFIPISEEIPSMSQSNNSNNIVEWRDFVRDLYRGTSAYADQMDHRLLRMLHVETDLDDAVIEAIEQGRSVVLTGNPGDGKTHLLRILESELENKSNSPGVEYDASAKTDEALLLHWQQTLDEGRPFCVAINEAVLINLSKMRNSNQYPDALRQVRSAQGQVENAVSYTNSDAGFSADVEVIVFDLSRRNVLSRRVVSRVIDILADPERLGPCGATSNDDLSLNTRLLKNELVRERLQSILDRVSQKGYHATVRELQSLISFLLFADRTCDQILKESGNYEKALPQLPFIGNGTLFAEIREAFDPSLVSHPLWDDLLITAQTQVEDWLDTWNETHAEISALSPGDWNRFEARKRAFYFFHDAGEDLLDIIGTDENDFVMFLDQVEDEQQNRNALRLIIERINRFFGHEDGRILQVWQSHRYDQSPRRIFYSATSRRVSEFEVVTPKLCSTMSRGFDLAVDHALLRLREDPKIRLRIDYALFELLSQAVQGVPVIALDNHLTRRIWQFMEPLVDTDQLREYEVEIKLSNLTTGEILKVELDNERKQYIRIEEGD
jgi:energy-coupling factor transporter ATP-binding protein EcfA2